MPRSSRIALATLAVLACATPASAQIPGLPPILPPPGGDPAPGPPPLPEPAVTDQVTETRVSPGGTYYSFDDSVIPPLFQRWKRSLGDASDEPAPPLVAGRQVFVALMGDSARVVALARSSGAVLWRRVLGGHNERVELTYEAGRVIAVTGSHRTILAFDASTGHTVWERQLPAVGGSPVSESGVVVLGANRQIMALNAADGSLRWQQTVPESNPGVFEPVIADGRVFTACINIAWRLSDGAPLWTRESDQYGCSARSIAYGGSVYEVKNGGDVVNGASGVGEGIFDGGSPFIFTPFVTISATDEGIVARASRRGAYAWSVKKHDCGENGCANAVAAGRNLYTIRQSRLVVLDLASGRFRWNGRIANRGADALAVGEGLVVILLQGAVYAYSSVLDPPAATLQEVTFDANVFYGEGTRLYGALGADHRANGSQKVTLTSDPFPFRGFRPAASANSAFDGGYEFFVRPRRNTAYRSQVGNALSEGGTVWVYPRVRAPIRRGRGRRTNHVTARVTMTGPPQVRLGGRRVHLYLVRVRKRRVTRLGGGRLRRAGRGRGRAIVHFRALRGLRQNDFLFYCVPHLTRVGLGQPGVVDRRCGARRLPF